MVGGRRWVLFVRWLRICSLWLEIFAGRRGRSSRETVVCAVLHAELNPALQLTDGAHGPALGHMCAESTYTVRRWRYL